MRLLNLRINFYLLQTFCSHLGSFFFYFFSLRFGQISPLAFFRWLTATSDRNAESCNRIPRNYCIPKLLSIAPRFFFWPSKPLTGLDRHWNRYLLTMLTWNRRDSTPLSAVPRAPKGNQGWIFFCLMNPIICSPYQVSHSWVHTEFLIFFIGNRFEMRLLNLRINCYLLRTFCPHLCSCFFVFTTKKKINSQTNTP